MFSKLGGHRGPPPPVRYPMPSRAEAMRRTRSIAVSLTGFIVIMTAMFGMMHIRYGDWPLGVFEILMGVAIAALVWMRFRGTV